MRPRRDSQDPPPPPHARTPPPPPQPPPASSSSPQLPHPPCLITSAEGQGRARNKPRRTRHRPEANKSSPSPCTRLVRFEGEEGRLSKAPPLHSGRAADTDRPTMIPPPLPYHPCPRSAARASSRAPSPAACSALPPTRPFPTPSGPNSPPRARQHVRGRVIASGSLLGPFPLSVTLPRIPRFHPFPLILGALTHTCLSCLSSALCPFCAPSSHAPFRKSIPSRSWGFLSSAKIVPSLICLTYLPRFTFPSLSHLPPSLAPLSSLSFSSSTQPFSPLHFCLLFFSRYQILILFSQVKGGSPFLL